MSDKSVLEYIARRTTAEFSILGSKGVSYGPPTGPEAKGKDEVIKVCFGATRQTKTKS
jgi:hypothetical protein